jgi:hypothetical protein
MRTSRALAATLLGALAASASLSAQGAQASAAPQAPAPAPPPDHAVLGAETPAALAKLVMDRFASGTAQSFDSVYPDPLGRAVVESAVGNEDKRVVGTTRVLATSADRAVLLLTGTVRSGGASGMETGSDETNRVRRFSGLYEATRTGSTWMLTRQIPLDTASYIRAQTLHVALSPGKHSDILDTMSVDIGSPYGLAMRLNNATQIASVQLDGHPAKYELGGGVLWVDAPKRPASRHSRLVLHYSIADEHQPDTSAAAKTAPDTLPAYGALNNTDVWHPFFNYDSSHDFGQLAVTVTVPAQYKLTTSVPQTESVRNGVRTVHGQSMHPQFLLAILYDRDWTPVTTRIGDLRFETFLTPQYHFSSDTLAKIVKRVYAVLVPRFGEPQLPSHYLAVVEDRALGHTGFAVRMNNAVISGDRATAMDESVLGPSYAFAHEVSHAWTMNATGPAANFLQEGWATFCESLVLRDVYGADAEHAFWERVRTSYATGLDRAGWRGGFEGKQSILGNPDNGRVHYFKGSWIFHQLDYVLGDSVYDRGMREYITRSGTGPDGYQEFIAAMSHAAGRDVSSLVMPWLTEKYIPDVDAHVDGQKLIVTQSQPSADFDLSLDVELTTDSGAVRRPVHLTSRADTVSIAELGPVSAVRVDPDHHFLLKRHWGEQVRFTLHAPQAKTVELAGNFMAKPIPATRDGDVWTVTMPMTEGRYIWVWRVDGKNPSDEASIAATKAPASPDALAGVRIVRPVQRLDDANAR